MNHCLLPANKNAIPISDWQESDSTVFLDSIPLQSQWKPAFYYSFGSTSVIGVDPERYSVYARGNGVCSFSFEEILDAFEIEEIDYLKPMSSTAQYESHRYRRDWYFFMKGELLVMRAVSSYPDGNQTSWYHEATYFFKAKQ